MSIEFAEPTLDEAIYLNTVEEWADRSSQDLANFVWDYELSRYRMSIWQKLLRATVGDYEKGQYWAAKKILSNRNMRSINNCLDNI